jgi:thioredoxin-related protein
MKKLILICAVLFVGTFAKGQLNFPDSVWMSMSEAKERFMKKQLPIIVNFYDSRSDSCRLMADSVFSDPIVSTYLKNSFYAVNVDVSSQEDITFFDGTVFKPQMPPLRHGIADALIPNLVIPAFVIFNTEGTGTVYNMYTNKHKMLAYLLYYAENAYRTSLFEDFYKEYSATFPENRGQGFSVVKELVKWKTMEEALAENAKNPKMIYLDIYSNWKNVCTMMIVSTYADKKVADFLNTNFYPVRMETTTKDTIRAFGQVFINPNKDPKVSMHHQFPTALLQNRMNLPSVLIFNGESKLLDVNQNYFSAPSMLAHLKFFKEELYKTQKYDTYMAPFRLAKDAEPVGGKKKP